MVLITPWDDETTPSGEEHSADTCWTTGGGAVDGAERRRRRLWPLLAAAVFALGSVLSTVLLDGATADTASNVAQLTAATAAALSAVRYGARATSRMRWAWTAVAAGCASWAAGQLVWTVQAIRGSAVPFPSLSDVGFLAFPLFAAIGLSLYPASGGRTARWQRWLDAVMTSILVALISWETTLGAVIANDLSDDTFESALLVAYPVSDVLLMVLTVLTVSRSRHHRVPLLLMGVGVSAISVSDSAFAFLQSTTAYEGGLVDLGWVLGFLLIAVAGVLGRTSAWTEVGDAPPAALQEPGRTAVLPYAPMAAALIVTVGIAASGRSLSGGELLAFAFVVALLLTRQYLTLRDNARLTSELAAREAMLRHQAFHDALTGLANRALFRDRLEHALALHARDLRQVSVIFLDLDDFKLINDTLGHAIGDELLVRISERLRGSVRSGDTVARLGGDEFAILIEDGGDALGTATKALDAFRAPVVIEEHSLDVQASVGVCTLAPDDAPVSADELLTRSDTAMYSAKRSGKSRIVSFTEGMSLVELEDQGLRLALRAAIDHREITLAFQPIVDVGTGAVVGLEALARWQRDGVPVGPDVFIPLAERSGMLTQLTDDVLAESCRRVAEWSVGRAEPLSVHVNVAPTQLVAPGFVASVAALVRRHQLPPGQLVVEITESGIFADLEVARRTVTALRELGVGVSLDDFGVGYSSLAQLNNMPLDSVKIDRSFLALIDQDARSARFFQALLRLAHDIDLPVVAEGVERPDQLAQLQRLGCPLAQGYLLGRPVPPHEVPALLGTPSVLIR
jgi:diguanylate cyclase (GGDEF)-like protein